MAQEAEKKQPSVVVSPSACVSMMLHAARHGTTAVHGILVGSHCRNNDVGGGGGLVIKIDSAVPVCHEAPTKPLVDTALALVSSVLNTTTSSRSSGSSSQEEQADEQHIVGWYTAPERLQDTRPGSASLRIVSSLADGEKKKNKEEPVLVVLQNENVAQCLVGEKNESKEVMKAYGKDFGQQWLEPLSMTLTKEMVGLDAAREGYKQKVVVNDFVDHLESDNPSTEWYPNTAVAECIAKHG